MSDAIRKLLASRMSGMNADAIMKRVARELNIHPSRLAHVEVRKLEESLRRNLRLFANEATIATLLVAVRRELGSVQTPPESRIVIDGEHDIAAARMAARRYCERAGASSFRAQAVVTAVSELTRNIVRYAGSGWLELSVQSFSGIQQIRIVACDEGPGIPHLDEVLSGRYRSKTGLGVGLNGVKRMMDSFDVKTGARGTTITVEARL